MTRAASAHRLRQILVGAIVFVICVVFPATSIYYAWVYVAAENGVTADFGRAYYPAAEKVLAGERIYPGDEFEFESGYIIEYVYPPLTAVALTPWTALPVDVASVLFSALLLLVPAAVLGVVGVRDWRCYGLAYLFAPVPHSLLTGNVTIALALAAALTWRFRDRPVTSGVSLGVGLATKIILWPLLFWLVAALRFMAAVWTLAVAGLVVVVSWAAIRFDYVREYPEMVLRLSDQQDERSYSLYALGVELGLPSTMAKGLWLSFGIGLLLGVAVLARGGQERRAFVLAIAAAIALSPIVWIHYFSLLLVALAVSQPRLGPAWFLALPMHFVVVDGAYNGSTFQTVAVLGLAAGIIGLSLRSAGRDTSDELVTGRPVAESP